MSGQAAQKGYAQQSAEEQVYRSSGICFSTICAGSDQNRSSKLAGVVQHVGENERGAPGMPDQNRLFCVQFAQGFLEQSRLYAGGRPFGLWPFAVPVSWTIKGIARNPREAASLTTLEKSREDRMPPWRKTIGRPVPFEVKWSRICSASTYSPAGGKAFLVVRSSLRLCTYKQRSKSKTKVKAVRINIRFIWKLIDENQPPYMNSIWCVNHVLIGMLMALMIPSFCKDGFFFFFYLPLC